MKKLVIALVCVGLLVVLTVPSIYSAKCLTYDLEFSGDVKGEVVECSARQRFISSSNVDEFRPTLWLDPVTFVKHGDGWYDGIYLDLSKQKDIITMQFFFIDPATGEKVQLNVYDGCVDPKFGDGEWLSANFKITFSAEAKITPTKGKKFPPLWYYEHVDITIHCQGK